MRRAHFIAICLAVAAVLYSNGRQLSPLVLADRQRTSRDQPAGTRRALLVGISNYKNFPMLEYPRNDVARLKDLLESPRYGFKVTVLSDDLGDTPDREHILNAMQRVLVDEAQPGDFCLFYFSGHGSRVRNSLSDESDKWDETIVPADAVRPVRSRSEFKDIRDKEIVDLFNRALKKNVKVTAIFDSCHSGSIARGDEQTKEIDGVDLDIRLAPTANQRIKPEDHGALILTASEDYQQAGGGWYELDGRGAKYSHFTAELLQTLYEDPADRVSARDIFRRVMARLVGAGRTQTPTIAATNERIEQTIFGGTTQATTGRAIVPITAKDDGGIKYMVLAGGLADGLADGDELRRIDLATRNETDPSVRIRIRKAGLSASEFEVKRADTRSAASTADDLKNGDEFEQVSWVSRKEQNLTVWLPPAWLSGAELIKTAKDFDKLKTNKSIIVLSEPAEDRRQGIIFAEQVGGKTEWKIRYESGAIESLGDKPTSADIVRSLLKNKQAKARIFIDLPPSLEARRAINASFSGGEGGIVLAANRGAANYELAGQLDQESGVIGYAWVLHGALSVESKGSGAASTRNETTTLPRITNWAAASSPSASAAELKILALKLAKIRGWLKLVSPIAIGSLEFPYRFEIRETSSSSPKNLKAGDFISEGRNYEMVLTASPASLKRNDKLLPEFWVYVINIDANGRATYALKNPESSKYGGMNNFDPQNPPAEIPLAPIRCIWSPFGTETFILLVTDKKLDDASALEFFGVRGRENMVRGTLNPLEELLEDIGVDVKTRGQYSTPDTWAVQHLILRSRGTTGYQAPPECRGAGEGT